MAGPGFLNVRLNDDWLADAVRGLLDDENLGLEPPPDDQSLKVVIDYSSPNVAKPMHVGHIRSTVIGESLARLFEALGHDVVRDNHLGDWGSQFGMILWGWKNERNEAAYNENPVGELARLYRSVASQIKTADDMEEQYARVFALEKQGKQSDAEALFNNLYDGTGLSLQDVHAVVDRGRRIETEARAETAKLHANDGENRHLWGQFMPHCLAALRPGLRPTRRLLRRPAWRELLRRHARRRGEVPPGQTAWPSRAKAPSSSSPTGTRPPSSFESETAPTTTPRPTWRPSSTGSRPGTLT